MSGIDCELLLRADAGMVPSERGVSLDHTASEVTAVRRNHDSLRRRDLLAAIAIACGMAATQTATATPYSPIVAASESPISPDDAVCNDCPWPPPHPLGSPPGVALPDNCLTQRINCIAFPQLPALVHNGRSGFSSPDYALCVYCFEDASPNPCDPDEWPGFPPPLGPMHCLSNVETSFTESVNYTIGAGFESELGTLTSIIEAATGIVDGETITKAGKCGSTALPPCSWAKFEYSFRVNTDVKYVMTLKLTSIYEFIDNSGLGIDCPFEGVTFSDPDCASRDIEITGNKVASSTALCRSIEAGNCPYEHEGDEEESL
jgi:hypothetical protein